MQNNIYMIEWIQLNAMKRKVPLRILLQRASEDEKKQRILKGKWPWSSAPKLL